MRLDVLDDQGEHVDSVECTLSASGEYVMVGLARYPIDLFLEVYTVSERIDRPYNFWALGYDPILAEEIDRGHTVYDRYHDQNYDGLEAIEL